MWRIGRCTLVQWQRRHKACLPGPSDCTWQGRQRPDSAGAIGQADWYGRPCHLHRVRWITPHRRTEAAGEGHGHCKPSSWTRQRNRQHYKYGCSPPWRPRYAVPLRAAANCKSAVSLQGATVCAAAYSSRTGARRPLRRGSTGSVKIMTLTALSTLRVYRHKRQARNRNPFRQLRLFLRRHHLRILTRSR
jgi:hypothetical protein